MSSHLTNQTIQDLMQAIIQAGMATSDARDLLLAGIDRDTLQIFGRALSAPASHQR